MVTGTIFGQALSAPALAKGDTYFFAKKYVSQFSQISICSLNVLAKQGFARYVDSDSASSRRADGSLNLSDRIRFDPETG
jgi:hypothetical protein